ncbi:hypothetical protein ID866_12461 [Astraeus odoratus]|nr:hypothetical protein ID866_12461 [Astraeus odoratus]
MSTHKSSMTTGTPAAKTVDWTKVLDEELATNIDDMDLVGDMKSWEKCRRLHAAHDAEMWRAEEAEEAEKHWKEEEARHQRKAEAEQKWEVEKRRQRASAAAEARKWQWADSEAQVSGSQANMHQEKVSMARMSPQGGECKKQVKKVADDNDDDEIVILSGWKTKWQGGGKSLKEITDQRWGELIQAVSTHMDVANGHLEQIASTAQSNSRKMQQHHLLMEGLVGQQQMLISRLVELSGAAGSEGAKKVAEG